MGAHTCDVSTAISRIVARRVVPAGRFSGVLVVAVLAVTGTAVFSLAAGARRTATAFDRFVTWSVPWDVTLGGAPADQEARIGEIREFSEVADMVALPSVGTIDTGLPGANGVATVSIDSEGRLDRFTRAKIIDGSVPGTETTDQIVLGASLADLLDVGVGDDVSVQLADGTAVSLRVHAVVVLVNDFPTLTSGPIGTAWVPQGFATAHPDAVIREEQTRLVRLVDGAEGVEGFREAATAAGLDEVDIAGETAEQSDGMRRILRTQAFALWLTVVVAAAAGLIAVYQLLRRAAAGVATALHTVQALGARRVDLALGGGLRGAALGAVATLIAWMGAIALSPLFPRGMARLAEPDPGLHADVVVLGLGAVGVIFAGAGLGALAVWSATRRDPRHNSSAVHLPGAGPVSSGVRFALEPDGRGAGSLRPGLIGLGATAAVLVAVSALGSSFDQLLERPELSGGWWDAFIQAQGDDATELQDGNAALLATLRTEPALAGLARGGWIGDTMIGGSPIPVMNLEPGAGIDPAMRAGRAPVGPSEVALGRTTMHNLGAAIGDVVELEVPGEARSSPPIALTVVGEVVLSSPIFFDVGPGEGALVSHAFLERWMPDSASTAPLLLRFPDSADSPSGLTQVLEQVDGEAFSFFRSERQDVAGLRDMRTVPWLLTLGTCALMLTTLTHRVLMSVRRHRRDYGVLRALGGTPHQLRLGVTVQSAVVALIAFVIGVPLGLLLASIAWQLVASELIVVPVVHIDWRLLAGAASLTLGLTIVIGLAVGERTQRKRPAELLRAE